MKRIKLTVAYDGTNYCGWQIQPNGITIEQVLNENLSRLLGEEIVVSGASRTDSGVHSLGNICIFDTNTRMPGEKICYAINQSLPDDIVVVGSEEVAPDWHPRYVNSRKTYEYRILNRKFPDPTRRLDTYFFHYELDVDAMKKAAAVLVGEHDFKSFCGNKHFKKSSVRTITDITIEESGGKIMLRFSGDGFLQNMVRILTGTLVEAGLGVREASSIADILEAKNRETAGRMAPPEGLFLREVRY